MQNFTSLADLLNATSDMLRPPERLTVSEAAEKYRYLNNPGAYVGPWRNDAVPYMQEVLDTLDSRQYTGCVFAGPAQCAKTELILNWLTFSVICSPADFFIIHMTQTEARDFRKRRIDRLHRHSPEVSKRLSPSANDDNVHDTIYRSGMLMTIGWPTISQLSGKPVGRVALTDYDRMPMNIDGEGSPYDLARKRTTTFGSFAMTLAESSPGYEIVNPRWLPNSPHEAPPTEGILALYNRGDRRRWYWKCPHCGEPFEPSFKLLRWPDTADPKEAGEAAHMVCPNNGCVISPDLKAETNRGGRWLKDGQVWTPSGEVIGDGARSDIASFWLKGPAAAFASWATLVTKYEQARIEFERTGSEQALKSTVNTDQGEPYVPRGGGSVRAPEDLKAAAENLGSEPCVPEGVRFLVATVDVQGNRFEVMVTGIKPVPVTLSGVASWQYDLVVIDRFPIVKSERLDDDGERHFVKPGSHPEDWNLLLTQVAEREYPLIDGSGFMAIKLVLPDSAGREATTTNAYDFYRRMRRNGVGHKFQLVKGDHRPSAPRVVLTYPDSQRKDRAADARGEIPVLLLNTNKIKDEIDHMLDRREDGGRIRYSDRMPDEFFTELTAEVRDHKGQWVNPKKLRNESFDLLVYAKAGALHLKVEQINWNAPPGWAKEWPENDLVRKADQEKRFAAKTDSGYDLSKLGRLLT